jgi:hypothetical protein
MARLNRIQDEVPWLRPIPVRLAMGLAPWAAIAAIAVALAFARFPRAVDRPPSGGSTPAMWTPAHPGGGFANEDWLGLPWVWLLWLVALAGAIWTIQRIRRGQSLLPKARLPRPRIDRAASRRPLTLGQRVVYVSVLATFSLWSGLGLGQQDPITYGTTVAPGPEVTDAQQSGGIWNDESHLGIGFGPLYVYRLRPGGAFSYIISIRDDWPVPITLLGLRRDPGPPDQGMPMERAFVPTGLGLLRDPAIVSAEPINVVPFHAVGLAPGQEVILVVAAVAGSCADPTADIPKDPPNTYTFNASLRFVYDVLGWRRVGEMHAPAKITIPTGGCISGG